jgi:hypothetical protein
MGVPSYQVHNVMKLFSHRLQRNAPEGHEPLGGQPGAVPAEGRRRSIAARVTSEIFQRLNRSGVEVRREALHMTPKAPPCGIGDRHGTEFTYQLIDSQNVARNATFSVQDPSFLIDRYEDLSDDGPGKH